MSTFLCHKNSIHTVESLTRDGATRGTVGEQSPPLLTKFIFVNHLNTDEKILGVWWGVTSPTMLEFQPEFVTSGLQRPDLNFLQLLTNLILCY